MSSLPTLPADGGWELPRFAPIAFADFTAELLALYEPPLRSIQTRDRMRMVLRAVAGLLPPSATTADLSPALVARFIASRPASEQSVTTHSLLAYLRVACNYAKSRGYLPMSPFDFRKKWVKVTIEPKKRHHSLEDIGRVLGLMRAEVEERDGWSRWRARRTLALAATVAYTGLRAAEAIFLRVEDVVMADRMILVRPHSGRRLKTEKAAQPVPMPPPLAEDLAGWLARRLDPAASLGPAARAQFESCAYVFPNTRGSNAWNGGSNETRPTGMVIAAGQRAGVEGFTLHSLRHSFATHAESAWGLSPATIQRVLRHTSLSTSERHYRHADAENLRRAVAGVDFGPRPAAEAGGADDAARG